jgi:hypothetical protein
VRNLGPDARAEKLRRSTPLHVCRDLPQQRYSNNTAYYSRFKIDAKRLKVVRMLLGTLALPIRSRQSRREYHYRLCPYGLAGLR